MLDSDLAKLYEFKNGTKEIKQAVKNNFDKFPKRYSFILTDRESQNFLVKNFDQNSKLEVVGFKLVKYREFKCSKVIILLRNKIKTII